MWFFILLIIVVDVFIIYKVYQNIKYKKEKREAKENYQTNENTECGPFNGDKVYHVIDCTGFKSLDVYRDKATMKDINDSKTFWYDRLNSAEIKVDLYDKKGSCYLVLDDGNDYDKYYDFGKPNYLKYRCTDDKAHEIADFINSCIRQTRSGNTSVQYAAQNQPQEPFQSVNEPSIRYGISKTGTSSFCEKCNEFSEEIYLFQVTSGNSSKTYELCKNCAIRFKQQIDTSIHR